MANLAQRFIWIELACGNSRTLAHTSEQTGRIDEIRPPRPDERGYVVAARDLAVGGVPLRSFLEWRSAWLSSQVSSCSAIPIEREIDKAVTKALVERIIIAESNGDANARNKRSSATGAAQFVDDTWLEAIRRHRRDLIRGAARRKCLELRRDPELTREIAAPVVEEYAAMLNKRGLPITPGSLYLAYFAGPAGAVALLSGAENADAASLMAAADATGRTTREKIVNANPFLKVLTVGDIKRWADRKMAAINSPGRL